MQKIPDFQAWKARAQRISMLTCYDFSTARLLARTSVDALLVGDSCAMVLHGHPDTLHATVDMMALHTAAVRRGAPDKLVIADLPFLSYRAGTDRAVDAVDALMKSGANAVKLEGADGNTELVAHLVASGVPVMGHLGLTPQSVQVLGGYRTQARDATRAARLVADARALEAAGCFAVVLECVPAEVAERVTGALSVPTIGIGCGPEVSGQVLVINDLLTMDPDFRPRFVRAYAGLGPLLVDAAQRYCEDVVAGRFPAIGEFVSEPALAEAGTGP